MIKKTLTLLSFSTLLFVSACFNGGGGGSSSFSSSGTIDLLRQNITQKTGKSDVVALLVPSSGIGYALSQAAEMAVFELKNPNIELKVIRTGDGNDAAIGAAQKAINAGARLILGPLFSAQTKAITPLCQQHKVPVLSFSNDKSAANSGVYVLGYDPSEQAAHIADYVVSRGYEKIAAFASYKPYAKLSVAALEKGLRRRSERLISSEPYTSINEDSAKKYQKEVGNVDAIFIPEGGPELNYAAGILSKAFAKKPFFFGPLSWGESNLSTANHLRGGAFSALSPNTRLRFKTRYRNIYGGTPATIASLAYDGVALAGYLSTTNFDPRALLNRSGFSGIDGTFALRSNGTVVREYRVAEVTNAGLKVIR